MNSFLNIIFLILKKAFLLFKFWLWDFPIFFSAICLFVNVGIICLISGGFDVNFSEEISKSFISEHIVYIFFGWPAFFSFGAIMGGSGNSSGKGSDALSDLIDFRNGQMLISSPSEAAEILKKTAHLDVMQQNQRSNEVFSSRHTDAIGHASSGFQASYGLHSPSTLYKDLVKKK